VKAFMTTRVGDMFLLLGLVALYSQVPAASSTPIFRARRGRANGSFAIAGLPWAWLIGILLFIGVGGQIGPVPAARLAARCDGRPDPGFGHDPCGHDGFRRCLPGAPHLPAGEHGLGAGIAAHACDGGDGGYRRFTALFAATIAVAQNDIKRVLAYSTISQLGYMIARWAWARTWRRRST
jgi:NADH-quinone oxidoreductase subunit L